MTWGSIATNFSAICEGSGAADYGTRVQKSVFECQVGRKEWVRLRDRLLHEVKAEEDSLRFYFLDEACVQRTEHHGAAKPVDLTEPLVL